VSAKLGNLLTAFLDGAKKSANKKFSKKKKKKKGRVLNAPSDTPRLLRRSVRRRFKDKRGKRENLKGKRKREQRGHAGRSSLFSWASLSRGGGTGGKV